MAAGTASLFLTHALALNLSLPLETCHEVQKASAFALRAR